MSASILTLFEAFTAIGIAPEQAKAAVLAMEQDREKYMERKFSEVSATKLDVSALNADLLRKVNELTGKMADTENRLNKNASDFQRWLITAIFGTLAAIAIIQKWGIPL